MLEFKEKATPKLLAAIVLIILASLAQILVEFFKGKILDYATQSSFHLLIHAVLILLALVIVKGVAHFGYTLMFQSYKVLKLSDLRKQLFFNWMAKPYPEFSKTSTGEYLSHYTNQVDMIDKSWYESIYGLLQIITEVFFGIVVLFYIHPVLAMTVLLFLIVLSSIPKWFESKIKQVQNNKIKTINLHINAFTDYIMGFELIKNYGIQMPIFRKLSDGIQLIQRETIRTQKQAQRIKTLTAIISQLSLFCVIFYVAMLLYRHVISVGMALTAIAIMQQLQTQVVHITFYYQELIRAKVTKEGLDCKLEIESATEKLTTQEIQNVKNISFDLVSFSYDKNPIINGFSWDINDHGLYLIRGQSGSGKSTLINLLLNYYKVTKGSVKINSIDVDSISNLMQHITIMRQDIIFFSDSLYCNLSMFQPVEKKRLKCYLKRFNLEKFASDEVLYQQTSNLRDCVSGGEARRLGLIRTLLRQSDILILDEPFANLDHDTIKIMEDEIATITDRIVIVISHQVSKRFSEKITHEIYLA